MENFLILIEEKIKSQIEIESIKIFDDTLKHKNHKSFISGKYHLRLIIFSEYLKSLPRIDAQKQVLNILKEEIQEKIHAIQIIIK
tara:strand:- start:571 stop:825 length:255 start_codon:yes stop_codon:yes gene_type:complete